MGFIYLLTCRMLIKKGYIVLVLKNSIPQLYSEKSYTTHTRYFSARDDHHCQVAA